MYWLPLLLTALLQETTVTSHQCGVPAGMTKIVGGRDIPFLRYPWYVALAMPFTPPPISVSCGGSLITSRHVLTAAHCFPDNLGVAPEELYRVVFELVNRCDQKEVQEGAIARVDINPEYNSQTLRGDMAIITLKEAVPYTPVCLPARNSMTTGEALIIGFGSTLAKSQYPCIMQEARVNIFTKRQCRRSGLSPEFSNIPGTICAGLLRGGVDSCDGDSGGPIQTLGPSGVYTIEGIVSFGEGCARKNLPGVYTQVSAYRDFIDTIIHSFSSTEDFSEGGSNSNTIEESSTSSPLPPNTSSVVLQGLLQELLRPWTDLFTPNSSSCDRGTSSAGDGGTAGVLANQRPLTALQAFLQGLFNRPKNPQRRPPLFS